MTIEFSLDLLIGWRQTRVAMKQDKKFIDCVAYGTREGNTMAKHDQDSEHHTRFHIQV